MIVTAVRDGSGDLANIVWNVDSTGKITRLGEARAAEISLVSVTSVGPGKFVTAVRDGSGNLANIAWGVDGAGNVRRLGEARAGKINFVSVTQTGVRPLRNSSTRWQWRSRKYRMECH